MNIGFPNRLQRLRMYLYGALGLFFLLILLLFFNLPPTADSNIHTLNFPYTKARLKYYTDRGCPKMKYCPLIRII